MLKFSISIHDYATIKAQWGDNQDISFEGWVDMKVKNGQNYRSTEINIPFSNNTINKQHNLRIQCN